MNSFQNSSGWKCFKTFWINLSGGILSFTFILCIIILLITYFLAAKQGYIPDCDGFSISQSINYGNGNLAGIVLLSLFSGLVILADFGIMCWRQERHKQYLCECTEPPNYCVCCYHSKSCCSWLTFAMIILGGFGAVMVALNPKDVHSAVDDINYTTCRDLPDVIEPKGPKMNIVHYIYAIITFGSLLAALFLELFVDFLEFYRKRGVRFRVLWNSGFWMVLQSVSTVLSILGFVFVYFCIFLCCSLPFLPVAFLLQMIIILSFLLSFFLPSFLSSFLPSFLPPFF
jgi:hypothetical protein